MRRQSTAKDDDAVSEILGVIKMLAMLVTIMGGVWVFLNPYLVAFNETRTGTVQATSPIVSKTALMLSETRRTGLEPAKLCR